ncbi:MAG: nucleotide sugar dehydrogenase, partial [Lentisphaerae bacterium]
ATAHDDIDYQELARRIPIVVDTRNTCPHRPNVIQA